MSAQKYCSILKSNIEKQFNILSNKYNITGKDKELFMTSFNSNIPMRKKTILIYEQKCKARKQDGTQCSRRHKLNESFCGKHITNQKYGIFQLKVTPTYASTQKKLEMEEKVEPPVNPVNIDIKTKTTVSTNSTTTLTKVTKSTKSTTKGKRGRKPKPKKEKILEFVTLRSVQIKNKYYYLDKCNILYNPEPINGQYEIIGKLKDIMNTEIYYTTSLS